ncbi:thiamine pyrophosphate-dependent enzyme [Nocardia sp. GCM10030253]|uniref:thiamine pyrophosphate-dependent enzyme n=1 Tax=Nocardia sp. GCM10030253 TaxID=3273404 RepID=UPI00362C5AD7
MVMNVADVMWKMLAEAGVKRCYGIVGDALNPTIDALRRHGGIEFVHVRHEEAGVFAAVAEACLTGDPVCVCGTAGPGVMHLPNGLMDAKREGVPVIAIAGDTVTSVLDTQALEEVNPYTAFAVASRYTGRIVNAEQTRAVVQTAIRTAVGERGPVVIALPGDVAVAKAPAGAYQAVLHRPPVLRPADEDLRALAELIDSAGTVTIFGGDGCREAHDEVVALAARLRAPVGYAYRGKQWLEWDNPFAVGMTGLLGWGGAYQAMHNCDLCLLLGTSFPFAEFYPEKPKKVQIDAKASAVGRRTHLDMGLVGDIKDTLRELLPLIAEKTDDAHLERAVHSTEKWRKRMSHYVTRGPRVSPIRPEYLVSTIDEMATQDAIFTVDTGTPCIWAARYITATRGRNIIGSLSWASMANAMPNAIGAALTCPTRQVIALCGDGGITMLLGDLITIATLELPVKLVVFDNAELDFVHIEMEEAGLLPFGTDLQNPDFSKVAKALGITGLRVDDPADVRGAVEQLLATPGPALLDAVVDPHALSMPPHVGFGEAEGFALSMAKQAINGSLDEVIDSTVGNVRLF